MFTEATVWGIGALSRRGAATCADKFPSEAGWAAGTQHITATFRAYKSYDEAAEDDAQVGTTNQAFAGALLHRKEPDPFITELARHDATDKKYASSVISIIKTPHLAQHDAQ